MNGRFRDGAGRRDLAGKCLKTAIILEEADDRHWQYKYQVLRPDFMSVEIDDPKKKIRDELYGKRHWFGK